MDNQLWRRFLVVSGLSAAAVAAPLLDIYGRSPEVFVANRTSSVEIFFFGLIISLAVPVLGLLILLAGNAIGSRTSNVIYQALVTVMALATGLIVSRQVFVESDAPALALTVVIGLIVWFLVQRIESIFVYAAFTIPLILAVFVGMSDSSRLIWDDTVTGASGISHVGNTDSVVLIQLDELPLASLMNEEGAINELLFPSFARLSEEGTWYRNAFSDSIATTQSVPAILTGNLGEKGLSPSSVDHPDNLFALLGAGYNMHVIEWVADMCPEDLCPDYAGRTPARFSALLADVGVVYGHLTLPVSGREQLPSIDNAWKGFLGQSSTPSGIGVEIEGLPVPEGKERADWLDWIQRITNGIDNNMGPTLSYVHLPAPHVPWVTNPSGTHYERPEEYTEVEGVEGGGRWTLDPAPALLGFQRHLYQLGLLDTMLGRLFDRLDETQMWDQSMVIVVADHGASFVPGEHRRWPYEDNREDLYRVPLLVKYPNQKEGGVDDRPAFGIDILPTIVEALAIESDWEF